MIETRITVFRFLALPGFLWLKLCALLCGFTWNEIVVTRETNEDPPWYGGKPGGEDDGKGRQ